MVALHRTDICRKGAYLNGMMPGNIIDTMSIYMQEKTLSLELWKESCAVYYCDVDVRNSIITVPFILKEFRYDFLQILVVIINECFPFCE